MTFLKDEKRIGNINIIHFKKKKHTKSNAPETDVTRPLDTPLHFPLQKITLL